MEKVWGSQRSSIETLESRTLLSASPLLYAASGHALHAAKAKVKLVIPNIKGGDYKGLARNSISGSVNTYELQVLSESKSGAIRAVVYIGPGNSVYEADRVSGTINGHYVITLRGHSGKASVTYKATLSTDLSTITGSDVVKVGHVVGTNPFSLARIVP